MPTLNFIIFTSLTSVIFFHALKTQGITKILRFRGLAFRYGLYILTGILVIFIIAFFYTYSFSYRILVADAQQNAINITQLTIARIRHVLQPVEDVPELLAKKLEFSDTDPKTVFKSIQEFVSTNTEVYGSAIAFEPYQCDPKEYYYAPYYYEHGDSVVMKMLGGDQYDYFSRDWYCTVKTLGRGIWSEPYFDEGGGNLFMCTYSVPFYKKINGERVFSGVVTMDISLSSLRKIVDTIHLYKTGYGFLVSRKGKIITHQDSTLINRDLLDLARKKNDTAAARAYKRMMMGETDFVRLRTIFEKNPEWMSFAPITGSEWSLGLVFPVKEIFSSFLDFFWRLSVIFGSSVIALLILIILITRKFTRPITRLVDATQRIGQGDFHAPLPVYKARDEITQLANSFSLMQVELQSYISDLKETTTAKEKIESELNIAHNIQMGLLPGSFPEREDCEIYALLEPAKVVSGDLYDFLFTENNHSYLAIGDVSGKGVPASLFMAITRTLFRAWIRKGEPVSRMVEDINRELCKDNPNQMFVTFIICDIDLATGMAEICNAGHNKPLLLRKNGNIEKIFSLGGIPLGIFGDTKYRSEKFILGTGDHLLLYTDGFTDAANRHDELFGEARLLECLASLADKNTKHGVGELIAGIRKFIGDAEQADDITLLSFKFTGSRREITAAGKPFLISSDTAGLKILNKIPEISTVGAFLGELSAKWRIPAGVVSHFNLILEEIISNIVFYGYIDESEHIIDLDFQKNDETVTITVTDDGIAFNILEQALPEDIGKPHDERKIGGLGIHLAKSLSDDIKYRREGNSNILIITKKINSN